ncbi:hypothetical protein ACFWA4_41745 [Streptomyces sp. NPDC060011]|uniref:Uncharacterized protein n=1 Tax=Prauserella salsuginis TaxID=387889 RepID=A0ABW6GC83_9PSEU
MSTTRRPLGTGPSTTARSTTTSTAPRLLPVEHVDREQLLEDDAEHQEVAAARPDRRTLGSGPAA